jgi:hypothetical protein
LERGYAWVNQGKGIGERQGGRIASLRNIGPHILKEIEIIGEASKKNLPEPHNTGNSLGIAF